MVWFIAIYALLGMLSFPFALGMVWYSKVNIPLLFSCHFIGTMILSYIATHFYCKLWWLWGLILSWQLVFFSLGCLLSVFGPDGPAPFYFWSSLCGIALIGGFLGGWISKKIKSKSPKT
jgi:hypothetical protein